MQPLYTLPHMSNALVRAGAYTEMRRRKPSARCLGAQNARTPTRALERLSRRCAEPGARIQADAAIVREPRMIMRSIALICRMFFAGAAHWLPWLSLAPVVTVIPVLMICVRRRYRPA